MAYVPLMCVRDKMESPNQLVYRRKIRMRLVPGLYSWFSLSKK